MTDNLYARPGRIIGVDGSSESNVQALPSPVAVPFRIFDIEIARSVEDTPGGWGAAREGKCGFGCACVYDSESNHTWVYGPQDQEMLAQDLEQGLVISFNGCGFDVPAIEGGIGRKLNIATHFDLLDSCMQANNGQRKGLKLEQIAQRTLGRGKSGDGAQAPIMFQRGLKGTENGVQDIVKLLRYCAMDVIIVRDLLSFVREHGFVVGPNGPLHLTLPPYFGQLQLR